MNNMKKTLLILLSAASIALAGCGNSAGMSKDSATAEDITAVENTAESSGDANDSSILMAGDIYGRSSYVFLPGSKSYDAEGNCG